MFSWVTLQPFSISIAVAICKSIASAPELSFELFSIVLNEMPIHFNNGTNDVFNFVFFLDNKPKPETIEIFSVKIRENGTYKLIKMSLADIWSHGWELRINNFADKEKMPHNEKDIRNQVELQQI